ncbi:MAG: DUF4394 domain-containing protein [Dehalococcoidia bacterium]
MRFLSGVRGERRLVGAALALMMALALAGAPGQAAKAQSLGDPILALTGGNRLIEFNSSSPGVITRSVTVTGLATDESLVGIDYRPANGRLYGVGSSNRLYLIDPATGAASAVGGPFAVPLEGVQFGVDFNPVPDRLRVVSNTGQSLRINPDNGAVVDGDPNTPGVQADGRLVYVDGSGRPVPGATGSLVGAAYTNNVARATTTTNYGIDARAGVLVTQGSVNGSPVSPNTGRLFTVGRLGIAATNAVGFDISRGGRAYASFTGFDGRTNLYLVDLSSAATHLIGMIGNGETISGFAIKP